MSDSIRYPRHSRNAIHRTYLAAAAPAFDPTLSRYVPPDRSQARHRGRGWPACPRRAGRLVLTRTGLAVPDRCDRLNCWSCVIPQAIRTGEAMAMARPTKAVKLTGLPVVWESAREVMRRFRRTLTRRGTVGEFAYFVEPNPGDSTMAHAHLWWRGDKLTIPKLCDAAATAGLGPVANLRLGYGEDIHHAIPTIEYGLKMILVDRPDEPTGWWPTARDYLSLNGEQLVHATNGFWQDWRGQPLTLRTARVVAHNWPRRLRPTGVLEGHPGAADANPSHLSHLAREFGMRGHRSTL
jgi:hypothetical protein